MILTDVLYLQSDLKPDVLTRPELYTEEEVTYLTAVNFIYRYLYDTGVLPKGSIGYRWFPDTVYFSIDSEHLKPYVKSISDATDDKIKAKVEEIFGRLFNPDKPVRGCDFCGALSLSSPMNLYRDICGCVGRSRECMFCSGYENRKVFRILEKKNRHDSEAAVLQLWTDTLWDDETNIFRIIRFRLAEISAKAAEMYENIISSTYKTYSLFARDPERSMKAHPVPLDKISVQELPF